MNPKLLYTIAAILLLWAGALAGAELASIETTPSTNDIEVRIGSFCIIIDDKPITTPDHFQHTKPQRVYMLYDPLKKQYLSVGKGFGGLNFWTTKDSASVWISKKEIDQAVSLMFGARRRAEIHAFVLLPVYLRDTDE